MPEIIMKDDGTQVEVYTAEELETQKQEVLEQYKAENPDKTTELEEKEAELLKVQEELKKFEGKDFNFGKLREQKEAAEAKRAALEVETSKLKSSIPDQLNTVKKEILESVYQDHYNETLKALSGEDPEVRKKIEYHYKRLSDPAGTKEEMSKKLQDAYLLATRQEDGGVLNTSVISSGGVSRVAKRSNQPFTSEDKVIGAKLGLSAEDFDKFGK